MDADRLTEADAHLAAARFYAESAIPRGETVTSPCLHVWVAGLMYVTDEDVEAVAAARLVVCQKCEVKYQDRDKTQDNPE